MSNSTVKIYGIEFDAESFHIGLELWEAAGESRDKIEAAARVFGELVGFNLCVLGSPPAPLETRRSYDLSFRVLRNHVRYAPQPAPVWWRQ